MEYSIEKNELRILQSLISKKGMQSIVDTAAEVFGNPLFVSDPGYKIICSSKREAAEDEFWKLVEGGGHSAPEYIAQILRSGDLGKVYKDDAPHVGKYPFAKKPFLAVRISDHARIMGHICVYGLNRDFTAEDKELLKILSRTISYEMLYEGMSEAYQMPYYNLFTDLIEGSLKDGRIVGENLKYLGVKLPEQFYLAVVQLKNPSAQAAGIYIRDHLLKKLSGAYGIIYKDVLVLLLPTTVIEEHRLEEGLKSYEPAVEHTVGISGLATDIGELHVYYRQALDAIAISEILEMEDRFCCYNRLRIYQILLSAKKDMDLRYLCDPVVRRMAEHDRKYHTTYLEDTEVYLNCNKNITKAAEKRCVHKNSMYYRISRIEEKFGLAFDEEESWFSILLSIKIIRLIESEESC